MIISFLCQDSYEAEKMSSIFSLQKDDTLFVRQIVKIIDNEVIIKLNDGTSHSILLKDKENALKLEKFFSDLSSNNFTKIISTNTLDNKANITINNK